MAKKHKKQKSVSAKTAAKPKVEFARKFGPRQIIGIMAILLLLVNLLLFSFRIIPAPAFWILLVAIWGVAFIAIKLIKEK